MSYQNLQDILTENFKIVALKAGNELVIKLIGSFDMEDPYYLIEPFFNNIDQAADKNEINKIIINTMELFFINSSTIKCIIKWIVKFSRSGKLLNYGIDFHINKNLVWQTQSFEYLKFLSNDKINILRF